MDLPMLSQGKIHRAIPQVHHKCPQKCGFVFSFSKEFCDGFSNTFPRKIHHIFLNPFTKCLPSSAKNFLLRIFRCITKVKPIVFCLEVNHKNVCQEFGVGIHRKNVSLLFLSAEIFAMDFPVHFLGKSIKKKESIRKMPAILSHEFCDGSQRDPSQNIAFCSVF